MKKLLIALSLLALATFAAAQDKEKKDEKKSQSSCDGYKQLKRKPTTARDSTAKKATQQETAKPNK